VKVQPALSVPVVCVHEKDACVEKIDVTAKAVDIGLSVAAVVQEVSLWLESALFAVEV
jgi:hypothetical protein